MSEPPSSPYQSKFFNFLNRKAIEVKEQVERTIRQAKLAANWGVQVVMYPLYLIFQSTRYASYRFQQTAQQTWKSLQPAKESDIPAEVDAPIQNLLASIEILELNPASLEIISASLPSLISTSASFSTEIAPATTETQIAERELQEQSLETIGGKLGHLGMISVASQLETRQLVLVTSSHQIIDILTPEQQKLLMRRIIWEIAVYKHNWRLRSLSSQGFPTRINPSRQSQVLRPIRWFWQAMAWLQRSEVAIAIDLFKESSLIPEIKSSEKIKPALARIIKELEIPGMAVVEQQLNSLDVAIAKAETYLLSGSNPSSLSSYPSPNDSQITAKSSDREPALAPPVNHLPMAESEGFSLQRLLWAAIDYFFGFQNSKNKGLASQGANSSIALPQNPSLSLPANYKPDDLNPWLAWNDLFPEPPVSNLPPSQPQSNNLPPSKSSSRPKLAGKNSRTSKLSPKDEIKPRSMWSAVKSFLGSEETKKIPKNLAQASYSALDADSSQELSRKPQKMGEAIATSSSSPSLEYTPNWIETEATSKGYVKSPLQRLLDWLDRIMLSLEKLFERIYRRIKG